MDAHFEDAQAVEQFHLLFLTQLGTRLDKKLYALKGGCNLRFFWKSIRSSQDIDFDLHTIATHTLQKNVRQILGATGFKQILRSFKIQLTNVSESKQTDTTQRWKVHLQTEASGIDLPTKIEFSRRKFDPGVVFGPADPEILNAYNLRPIIASHYDLESAFAQKIEALLGRKETQARDIFDLALLSERGAKGSAAKMGKEKLARACEIALSVPFDQFQGQVVAYLAPQYQPYYGNRGAWDSLQKNVVRALENI
jgi:predicted nucleotidyltransferase component of viral defense system